MKNFKLLTVLLLSVFVSFFHFNYAQDSLIQMSDGSIKRVTYLSKGKPIGEIKPVKSVPILDTNLYQKYGARKYIQSFEHPIVVDTLTDFRYNDFLTQKTTTRVIVKLSQGRMMPKTYLSPSSIYWTWEWIYIVICAIILFYIRRRWNFLNRKIKGGLIIGLSAGLGSGLGAVLIFCLGAGLNAYLSAGLGTDLILGLIFGLIIGWVLGWVLGLDAGLARGLTFGLIFGLVRGLTFSLLRDEISWHTILYVVVFLLISYLLGYLMRKKTVDTEAESFDAFEEVKN